MFIVGSQQQRKNRQIDTQRNELTDRKTNTEKRFGLNNNDLLI